MFWGKIIMIGSRRSKSWMKSRGQTKKLDSEKNILRKKVVGEQKGMKRRKTIGKKEEKSRAKEKEEKEDRLEEEQSEQREMQGSMETSEEEEEGDMHEEMEEEEREAEERATVDLNLEAVRERMMRGRNNGNHDRDDYRNLSYRQYLSG
jgi:hypothetical protein